MIFSSCKKLITAERNKLGDDIIEATECLTVRLSDWLDRNAILYNK
jgi:hypothetical protein